MNKGQVNSIQHLGVGCKNLPETWSWYVKKFGMDVPMFDSVAEAPLMDIYTNGSTVNKRAAMIFNIQGGGAMEVVELRSETTRFPEFEVQVGDLGIFTGIIKAPASTIDRAISRLMSDGDGVTGIVTSTPNGKKSLVLKDPNGLFFQLTEGDEFYLNGKYDTGGIAGCMIGCTDMEASKKFYAVLGYSEVIYEEEGTFEDISSLPGGTGKFRRCRLGQKGPVTGGFAEAIGQTWIELFQALDREPRKIYQDRIWGDVGFVHLGFDVRGMEDLRKELLNIGHPFTCDSLQSLAMGNTHVHCTYVEDPDGALIELTEVYRIPIVEKWGIFMNLSKRPANKPIPKFLFRFSKMNRVKPDYWEKNPK